MHISDLPEIVNSSSQKEDYNTNSKPSNDLVRYEPNYKLKTANLTRSWRQKWNWLWCATNIRNICWPLWPWLL